MIERANLNHDLSNCTRMDRHPRARTVYQGIGPQALGAFGPRIGFAYDLPGTR